MRKMPKAGIYKLEFSDGSYYVGQATNLVKREQDHISALKNGTHFNRNVQSKYSKLNSFPTFLVVCYCEIGLLNSKETELIDLNDSMCMNIMAGGKSTYGEAHPCSKYSTEEVINAFNMLLAAPGVLHQEVADIVGIHVGTVHDISAGRGRAYTELKKLYPEAYARLLGRKADNTRGKNTTVFRHVNGEEVTLLTGEYSEFCRKNGIHMSNMSKVIKGSRKSTGGWYLVETYTN